MDKQSKLNERQRAVLGTVAIALIVAAVFYVPWRIESTGDLAWAPFYRNPVVGRSTLLDDSLDSRYIQLKGRPVYAIYVLQLVGIGAIGTLAYWAVREQSKSESEPENQPSNDSA